MLELDKLRIENYKNKSNKVYINSRNSNNLKINQFLT